jgi:hypothetical protein
MSGDVKVIQPVDPSASPTTITTVGGSVGTVQELFIPREDFSANPSYQVTTCYVLHGGDSTNQPCDES